MKNIKSIMLAALTLFCQSSFSNELDNRFNTQDINLAPKAPVECNLRSPSKRSESTAFVNVASKEKRVESPIIKSQSGRGVRD
jgi:hypothetical protein